MPVKNIEDRPFESKPYLTRPRIHRGSRGCGSAMSSEQQAFSAKEKGIAGHLFQPDCRAVLKCRMMVAKIKKERTCAKPLPNPQGLIPPPSAHHLLRNFDIFNIGQFHFSRCCHQANDGCKQAIYNGDGGDDQQYFNNGQSPPLAKLEFKNARGPDILFELIVASFMGIRAGAEKPVFYIRMPVSP
jgi:hypothetical protein